MSQEEFFYKNIIDNLYDGVYFVDRERVVTYWNKGAERLTGYTAEQTLGRSCRDSLLNHVTANGLHLCESNCPLAEVMQDGREREGEVFLHHADGHRVPVVVRAVPIRNESGDIIGAVESFSSNSHMIHAHSKIQELHQIAMTDPLTGIGNRHHLDGRLSAAIAEYERNTSMAGVLFIDVDDFKKFNDLHGHNTGDAVLRMVARTLRYALRATDTIGRWGGEEFIAILYDMPDQTTLQVPAEKVRHLVECSRLDVNGQGLSVTVSIGGTLLHQGDTPELLIQRADMLMYGSKNTGRNRVTVG